MSGVRMMRAKGIPEVRSAAISLSAVSRPKASRAPKSVANGNAVDAVSGTRKTRNRSTRKTGAPWLMM